VLPSVNQSAELTEDPEEFREEVTTGNIDGGAKLALLLQFSRLPRAFCNTGSIRDACSAVELS